MPTSTRKAASALPRGVTVTQPVMRPVGRVNPNEPEHVRLARVAMAADLPIVWWGPPGIGKSRMLEALVAEMFPGLPLVTLIASLYDPAEFVGLPVVEDGVTLRAVPAWLGVLEEAGGGVIFLDEVSNTSRMGQAGLMRLTLDRVLGDTPLPAGTRIVLAANPADCAADGYELAAPLANRLLHADVPVPEVGAWIEDYMIPTYSDTPARRRAAALVTGFVRTFPKALHDLPKDEAARGRAWPSPRSWDAACRALAVAIDMGREADGLLAVGASVGLLWGSQFVTFANTMALPDIRHLLDGHDGAGNPVTWTPTYSRPDVVAAVVTALAIEATGAHNASRAAKDVETASRYFMAAVGVAKDVLVPAARRIRAWRKANPGREGAHEAAAMNEMGPVLDAAVDVLREREARR